FTSLLATRPSVHWLTERRTQNAECRTKKSAILNSSFCVLRSAFLVTSWPAHESIERNGHLENQFPHASHLVGHAAAASFHWLTECRTQNAECRTKKSAVLNSSFCV